MSEMKEHSFQEVIYTFNRMCGSYDDALIAAGKCAFSGGYCIIEQCKEKLFSNPVKSEKAIMKWAKDNPEPEYCSWSEYFYSIGILPGTSLCATCEEVISILSNALATPIRSDIAKKLGLEPKNSR